MMSTTEVNQKAHKKHNSPNKHHHHGGGAARPSSGVDLMNGWTHAARGVGVLARACSNAAVEAI